MPTSDTPRRRLGLIVNPLAGLGGRVGLKGTDGRDVQQRALELGARPDAPSRADRALARLESERDRLHVTAAPGAMGADMATARGFELDVVGVPRGETTSRDTQEAASAMVAQGIDLLLFAGGDGTARDILDVLGTSIPVLGIPAGVKMRSGVFAASPEAAADAAAHYLGRPSAQALRDGEVVDLDETALREDRISGELYGYLRVPSERARVLSAKSSSQPGGAAVAAVCEELADEIRRGGLYIVGPGTTTQGILHHLGVEGTLLGIDVIEDGALIIRDAGEQELLDVAEGQAATIIVGIVGGQGVLFGRGNQQISAEVIRRAGTTAIVIVAGLDKLLALDPPWLRVDTGDSEVDSMLAGYRRVRYAPSMSALYKVAS
jgi:predicted polyphosphate/ATP-dependent NAD kinase